MAEGLRAEPLREKVKDALLERILSGELRPGADINENRLADELGVSRTPLREALHSLRGERLIANRPGRGFLVAPLDLEEAENLYEATGMLESCILEEWGAPDADALEEMRALTDRRERESDDPRRNVEFDWRWHDLALSACRNQVLLDLVDRVKTRVLRYELLYQLDLDRVESALESHREIERLLADGEIAAAAAELRRQWMTGVRIAEALVD